MRIRNLDVGVEQITEWHVDHEFHLPSNGTAAAAFLPQARPLDAILKRPSLDERLPDLLQPLELDPLLLDPSTLTETRRSARGFFQAQSLSAGGEASGIFAAAARLLEDDDTMDGEIRAALATLLRG